MTRRTRLIATLTDTASGLRLLSACAFAVWSIAAEATDPREVFSRDSPAWLLAVGKLQVPGQRYSDGHASHHTEDCSATLVTRPGRKRADTIITAWHCLEWYGDLSKPIVFTLVSLSGETLRHEAYRLGDGGGMHADWAILRLRSTVPETDVAALQIHPQVPDHELPVTMAGFSGDPGKGKDGMVLTFDPNCAITAQDRNLGDTNCMAFKGASGGAVVQLSSAGEPRMCGVISQGNGEGRSTFVPVSTFRNALELYLK
jgi:Trypsin-like peptidase domain